MPTPGGLLLEHFARLAASVAEAPMAAVSVLGRRSDGGPRSAAFGLPKELLKTISRIDAILESGPLLIVVHDPARDVRFTGVLPIADHRAPRFLCHMKLLSSGGERVGFICVFDQTPRFSLTDNQAASLGHLASMIIADRRREQRHFHLMHVANRALRIDRMLRLVSDATSCADALTGLLEELCRFHGAVIGRIWQAIQVNSPMLEISQYNKDLQTGHGAYDLGPATALNALSAEAILCNEPRAISFRKFGSTGGSEVADTAGLAGQVCVPIWVQQQRFGIFLGFSDETAEFDAVLADISSLADAIRPALLRKVTEERIRFLAHHDDLTQLPNRLMFQERLDAALAAARSGKHKFALLCLDLDGFKLVNDTCGHEIGDKLLVAAARRLQASIREGDTVARMGGDEFAIVQPFSSGPAEAVILARKLLEAMRRPFELEGQRSAVGVSIGVALYPQDGESPDLLLRKADTALYQAKKAGRNTFRLFNDTMQVHPQERTIAEQELREAIDGKQFKLAYQPVCDTVSLSIVGVEALLRWTHPVRGPIPPDEFIRLSESTGLIVPLGRWVLESACAEAATWASPVRVSVNLSPLQFRQPDLPQQVADVLSRAGLPAERLDLEVTEGLLLDEPDLVKRTMRALQEQGIHITLDDFGTAYASLSYLHRFPFDRIKIDKSFVRGLYDDDSTLAIVQAILSLGDRLNLTVVAEGVETERELDALRNLGCRFVQGYLSGRPMASEQISAMLRYPERLGGPQIAAVVNDRRRSFAQRDGAIEAVAPLSRVRPKVG